MHEENTVRSLIDLSSKERSSLFLDVLTAKCEEMKLTILSLENELESNGNQK